MTLNKKTILISVLAILVLGAAILGIFLFQNEQEPEPKETPGGSSNISDKNSGEEGRGSPTTTSPKPRSCEEVEKEELKQKCREYNSIRQKVEKEGADATTCGDLEPEELADTCRYEIIFKNTEEASPSDCQEINDPRIKGVCYKNFAVRDNDPDICQNLEAPQNRKCRDAVIAFNHGRRDDIRKCSQIKNPSFFLRCIEKAGGEQKCLNFEKEETVERCQSWDLFNKALSNGKEETCSDIPLSRFRNVCDNYFKNDQKFVDSDGDGASNRLELYLGTDPFKKEEDIDEMIAIDSQWAQASFTEYDRLKQDLENSGIKVD